MVDADTEVVPDSLAHLVFRMEMDTKIMGLTGETLIENRFGSFSCF